MAVFKACRDLFCGAVVACLLWGESIDRAENAYCMRVGVCFERPGAWAWVMASVKTCRENTRTHMYEHIFMMDCACGPRHGVRVMKNM